ncbi:MAG: hypothetical protein KBC83_00310 [Candidatus Moranbacteria bacterium]|nr:hypothetical protein [Candidatus Moranbacteria bacterium]
MVSFEQSSLVSGKQEKTAPKGAEHFDDGKKVRKENPASPHFGVEEGNVSSDMAVPEQRATTSHRTFLAQHDTGALSTMLRREVEIKARLREKLEKEFREKDVSKPPKLRHESVAGIDRALALAEPAREKPIHPQVFREARGKLVDLLEKRNKFVLSKKGYEQYFTDKHLERKGFRQGNVGDCYAVAALHALSESPNFEMLVRSSCRRLPDGTWKVRIPLLDERGAMISISPEEISSQRNTGFLKWDDTRGLDRRKVLHPLQGSEGMRVLEAAYIKAKFGSVNRLAAEGGYGNEVLTHLLGKKQVIDTSFQMVPSDSRGQQFQGKAEGDTIPSIDRFLREFDLETSLVTVNSRAFTPGRWDKIRQSFGFPRRIYYRGRGIEKRFVRNHVYSLLKVDQKKRGVILTNPWDTAEPIELSFDQLRENFRSVSAVRLNHAKLLENAASRAE